MAGTAATFQTTYLTPPNALPTRHRGRVGGALYTLTSMLAVGHSISVAEAAVAATPRHVKALADASTAVGFEQCRADFLAITGP